ncbi:hypothetical protein CVT26_009960 [Gymnopilus dilepis]|uniref:Uncharacterized protein n=1 Tax=Gymnopilus dilepis TaxID=231916 RepID=A0A409VL49_9AGAR|nr:hypothetical protein CVT26_009960 [Gymnopilus dilepis]
MVDVKVDVRGVAMGRTSVSSMANSPRTRAITANHTLTLHSRPLLLLTLSVASVYARIHSTSHPPAYASALCPSSYLPQAQPRVQVLQVSLLHPAPAVISRYSPPLLKSTSAFRLSDQTKILEDAYDHVHAHPLLSFLLDAQEHARSYECAIPPSQSPFPFLLLLKVQDSGSGSTWL